MEKKQTFFNKAISIMITLILLIPLINWIYHATDSTILENASDYFAFEVTSVHPEPQEKNAFVSGIILFPIINLCILYLIRNIKISEKKLTIINSIIGGITAIIIAIISVLALKGTDFFIIKKTLYYNHPLTILIGTASVMGLMYMCKKFPKINKTMSILNWIILSITSIGLLLFSMFRVDTMQEFHHFNAVFYAISQTIQGKVILHDLTHQYGLYPQMIEPILNLVGPSILNFTIIMGILFAISYLLIFFVLNKIIKNKAIVIAAFLSIISFNVIDAFHHYPYPYFQYYPVRTIFPSVFIFLAWLYTEKKQPIIKDSGYIVGTLAALWNMDSGLVSLLAWFIGMTYIDLISDQKHKIISTAKEIIKGILISTTTIAGYCGYIWLRFGVIPDLSQINKFQKIFYIFGFISHEMPVIHPWNIILLIYGIAITQGVYALIKQKQNKTTNFIFFTAIIGIGIFTYYQGRSLDVVMTAVWYPSQIILAIFLAQMFNNKKTLWNSVSIIAITLLLSNGALSAIQNSPVIINIKQYKDLIFAEPITERIHLTNSKFIQVNTEPGEEIFIFSDNSGIYHLESKTTSAIKVPGQIEIILKDDYERILRAIRNQSVSKIFWEYKDNQRVTPLIQQLLSENYIIKKIGPSKHIALLVPRNHLNQEKKSIFLLKDQPQTEVHLKLNVNDFSNYSKTKGLLNMIEGPLEPISLGDTFTLEMLVYPYKDQTALGTIVSNHPGYENEYPAGFTIHKRDAESYVYQFGFGTTDKTWTPSMEFPLKPENWQYLVIKKTPRTLEIFVNGERVSETVLLQTIKNTTMPLVIGNWIETTRFYHGIIQELQISNTAIDKKDIIKNWINIQEKKNFY